MAYKQDGYRGNRTNSFKEIAGLTGAGETDPPYKTGDTIKSGGKSYEIVSTDGSSVKVRTGSGQITTISSQEAQKKWVATKQMEGVVSSRPNVRTSTSDPNEEAIKDDMNENIVLSDQQNTIVDFNKFVEND